MRQIQTTITRPINIYIESDNVNADSENDESEQLRGVINIFMF